MPDRTPPSPGARRAAAVVLGVLCIPLVIVFVGLCIRLAEWAF